MLSYETTQKPGDQALLSAPHPSVYGKNKLHSVVFKERQKVEWVGHGIDIEETGMVQIWEELGWYRSGRSCHGIDMGGAGMVQTWENLGWYRYGKSWDGTDMGGTGMVQICEELGWYRYGRS